jgi:hypothetical protein
MIACFILCDCHDQLAQDGSITVMVDTNRSGASQIVSKLASRTKPINVAKENYDLLPMLAHECFLGALIDPAHSCNVQMKNSSLCMVASAEFWRM